MSGAEWIENRPDAEIAARARCVASDRVDPAHRARWAWLDGEWASLVQETRRRGWPDPLTPPQGEQETLL